MCKHLIINLKSVFLTALMAVCIWSCKDDKPQIHIPGSGPVIPQKEFKHVETITPDTLTFNEGDSAVFRLRTIPYNLLSRDSLTVQIADTAGAKYGYAEIKSYKLSKDSIWNIVMHVTYGMKSGDIISIMVADRDTVIYSDETVLNMIPKPVEPVKEYGVRIINRDTIAAFIYGTGATLRLKTAPWNLLFADSIAAVTLARPDGTDAGTGFRLDSVRFQPKDSTWNASVTILDNSLESDWLSVRLACPDTTVLSDSVKVLKVNISMSQVKVGIQRNMTLSGSTFSYFMPTTTDFSGQKFKFYHNGDKVTVGDSVMVENEYNYINANKPITVSVWKYDAHREYTLHMYNTGLPVVRINTGGKIITSRKDWYEGMTMRIEYPDGTVDYEGTLSIRGRGNGTWVENDNNFNQPAKKPYALKLDEKAKILGMHMHKRWILLANYKDRTLLRNVAAYWLSKKTDLPYTVKGRFVELVWNGEHKGNYYLCEQVKIDNHRVDIPDPNLEDPTKGGILLEVDTYYNYYTNSKYPKKWELGFISDRFRVPYIFKKPDETMIDESSATYTYVKNYINNLESIIMDDTRLKNREYLKYLDIDKAIDFLLIQELTMNNDSYNTWPSNGPHSEFMYIDSLGMLCFGPVWDFDYHTFTLYDENGNQSRRLEQWELLDLKNKNNQNYYFNRLKNDPEFKRTLIDRWDLHKDKFKQLPDYIRTMADSIRLSEKENYNVWGRINNPNGNQNGDQNLSFDESVNAMIQAFNKRWDWIEMKIGWYRNDINYH